MSGATLVEISSAGVLNITKEGGGAGGGIKGSTTRAGESSARCARTRTNARNVHERERERERARAQRRTRGIAERKWDDAAMMQGGAKYDTSEIYSTST